MQVLNFLYEKPTTSWLDFACNTNGVYTHLGTPASDPSADQLISQLVEQAQAVEKDASVELLPDDVEYLQRKAVALRILALKIWAFKNWRVDVVIKSTPLHLQRQLLDELLLQTSSTLAHLSEDSRSENIFSVIIFCRWLLQTIYNESIPKPGPRVSVSNPLLMPDPAFANRDATQMALHDLRVLSMHAVEILETWLQNESLHQHFKVIGEDTFAFPAMISTESVLELSTSTPYSAKMPVPQHNFAHLNDTDMASVRLQLHYDLGAYYLLCEKYSKAKGHFSYVAEHLVNVTDPQPDDAGASTSFCNIDRQRLSGYCRALRIDIKPSLATTDALNDSVSAAASIAIGKSANELRDLLQRDNISKELSMAVRHMPTTSNNKKTSEKSPLIDILNGLRGWSDYRTTTHCLVRTLQDANTIRAFCTALKDMLSHPQCPTNRSAVQAYLRFLCSLLPKLGEQLAYHDILSFFPAECASYIQYQQAKRIDPAAPSLRLTDFTDPQWELQSTYHPTKIKQVAAKCPYRTSVFWEIPKGLNEALNLMPPGIVQDHCGIMIAKSRQLLALNLVDPATRLLQQAETELRSTGANAPLAFKWEELRGRLHAWHANMHLQTDATVHGTNTQALATSVKALITEVVSQPNLSGPGSDLWLLVACFLLNTCDWEYLLMHCRVVSSETDFAKLVAAMCYEITRNGENVALLSREFFNMLLMTFTDNPQYKRAAGPGSSTSTTVLREQKSLVTRANLTTFTKQIREPLSLSLLLSFYAKVYNTTNSGALCNVNCEHLALWPKQNQEPANLVPEYLELVLKIALENAVMANPVNAQWLRAYGDFLNSATQDYPGALSFYIQSLLVRTEGLARPLQESLDSSFVQQMAKCFSKLKCHTQEALVCQLADSPDYPTVLKALEQDECWDSSDAMYPFIWDINVLEALIFSLHKRQLATKMDVALKCFDALDISAHNPKEVRELAFYKRLMKFLDLLAKQYCIERLC